MVKYIEIKRKDGGTTFVRSSIDSLAELPLTDQEELINELYQQIEKLNKEKNAQEQDCDDSKKKKSYKNDKGHYIVADNSSVKSNRSECE